MRTLPTWATGCLLLFALCRALDGQERVTSSGPLHLGARTAVIGVLEGDSLQEFGEVGAVSLLPDGRVVVLDRRLPSLHLFTSGGRPLFVAGRAGSGPGEFRLPSQLRILRGGDLGVLDFGLSRMSFFSLIRDSIQFRRSFQVAPPAREFCVLGDSLYVAGAPTGDSTTLRRYTLNGAEAGSLGELFPDLSDRILAAAVSAGLRVECQQKAGLVLLASEWLPTVRAYDARSGRRLWETRLSGFQEAIIEHRVPGIEGRGSAIAFRPPPSQSIHKVAGILALPEGTVLVQLERIWRPAGGGPTRTEYEIRLLRSESGVEIGSYRNVPRVFANSGGTIVIADTTDYPRLLIYRLEAHAHR